MLQLSIVSGTDRSDSNALKIARYLKQKYETLDVEADILDLQNFPLQEVSGGHYNHAIPAIKHFVEPMLAADGMVVVCPEYNGGFPGILKLFIDYLPFPKAMDKKPICFVGEATGAFGGLRAVEQLQQVVGYRNAHIFPERVFISRVHENFDASKGIDDELQQELLEDQIKHFVPYVSHFRQVEK